MGDGTGERGPGKLSSCNLHRSHYPRDVARQHKLALSRVASCYRGVSAISTNSRAYRDYANQLLMNLLSKDSTKCDNLVHTASFAT
jgi:hypothetical protein